MDYLTYKSIEKEIKLHEILRNSHRERFLKQGGEQAEQDIFVEAGIIKGLRIALDRIVKLNPNLKEG